MQWQWAVSVFVVFSGLVTGHYRRYDGYHVLRITPTTQDQLDALIKLQERGDEVDLWSYPARVNKDIQLSVSPEKRDDVTQFLSEFGLKHEITSRNLQKDIEQSMGHRMGKRTMEEERTFQLFDYNDFETINARLEEVAETCSVCELFNVGESYEGRDIKGVKIGKEGRQIVKPAIWIDAGIHAREWIAPATAMYLIEKLAENWMGNNRRVDRLVARMIETYDFYIAPCINPDGYAYSHSHDRLWRKTRQPNAGSNCIGTDPNRNWDFHWMLTGASDNPCSEVYAGPIAFSEPETQAVADFLESGPNFLLYLTFHSYGQYWLTPWGYTSDYPDNYNELERVANIATEAIQAHSGQRYTVGTSTNVLYSAAGGSDDWAMGVAGIPYSYTVELRDRGSYGFVLPTHLIQPTVEEMWIAIRALVPELRANAPL